MDFRLLSDSIMDEVGNNNLHGNVIKRENMNATYDCHTYQLTPDSPIPSSQTQTHVQSQVQNQGGTIVPHPIPTDYSSKYFKGRIKQSHTYIYECLYARVVLIPYRAVN